MQNQMTGATLFEVSWEVCNKVGGIYAVVNSKALEVVEKFGDNYYLLGPDLGNNADFEETDEPCWDALGQITSMRNLNCRFGRWNIPGNPKVILVNFKDRYNQNQLLYELWSRYGVDSLSAERQVLLCRRYPVCRLSEHFSAASHRSGNMPTSERCKIVR